MPVNFAPLPKRTPRWLFGLTVAVAVGLPTGLLAALLVLLPVAKPAMLDALLRQQGIDPATWAWRDLVYAGALFVVGLVLFTWGAIFGGIGTWLERKIAGRMQSRIGPNRAGAGGFLIWVADAVKMLLKEDLVPGEADHLLFRIAPYFGVVGFLLTFVVLPFGESLIVSDLNVGIFFITSITALVVVGILVAGWSSNSKWALFGGFRSAAQVISYEIPAGISLMVPVLMAGTLSMQGIIRAQGGAPWNWFLFRNPAGLIAFFIFFISQLAEANRTPFDLPEAESELVAGYLSEYSGFRFGLFFLVEYGNLWVMAATAVTLFLGGWQIPGIHADAYLTARGTGAFPALAWWGLQAASMAVFTVKTVFLVLVVLWIRWTLPRVRIDQMMDLCWKYLVPASFACFVFTLLWQMLVVVAPKVELVSGVVLSLAALAVVLLFLKQVRDNVFSVAGDKIDLSNW
jgi:NADH-quinone oxidoreductase subunit H